MPKAKWTKARRDKYMATLARKRQGVIRSVVTDLHAERPPAAKLNGAHPNAELIGKVLDALVNPQTNAAGAERLLAVLDKLMP